MKFATIVFLLFTSVLFSQKRTIPIDTSIITSHNVTIRGKSIDYKAEIGMQPVWDDMGDPIASLYYTYYTTDLKKDSKETSSRANRPIVFSFNGGPGSASVWMHIAYTGPVVLNIDDEGYPIQPYGVKENPHSILDVADIVYINPVNTGYSRMIPNKDGEMPDRKQFFGINQDIKYLAEWMNTFVSRHNRW